MEIEMSGNYYEIKIMEQIAEYLFANYETAVVSSETNYVYGDCRHNRHNTAKLIVEPKVVHHPEVMECL